MLVQDLRDQGYDEEEIVQALEILASMEDIEVQVRHRGRYPRSYRLLAEEEKARFDTRSQGLLIELQHFDIVDPDQLEEIIERSLALNTQRVTHADVLAITTEVVAQTSGPLSASHVWHFFQRQ
jgi:uncharacterized protein Smg (DUF494 family)